MATYVLGDLHGCFDTLRALWRQLPFDAAVDRLWLAGDLANRGPGALATVRWCREMADRLGDRFVAVLGNHDLHLLRRAAGLRPAKPRDTLDQILEAEDGDALVEWVARLPLLYRQRLDTLSGDREWCLVHAGMWPGWDAATAEAEARRATAWLADAKARPRALDLTSVEGGPVAPCSASQHGENQRGETHRDEPHPRTSVGEDRPLDNPETDAELAAVRQALFAFTELRTLRAGGEPCRDFTGPPQAAPPGCRAWYLHPARLAGHPGTPAAGSEGAGGHVVFGHWAALGFHRGDGVLALDTGAVWGGGLTAARLEDGAVFFQETVEADRLLPINRN